MLQNEEISHTHTHAANPTNIYILIRYLFDTREIEMKPIIDPTQNLIPSNKVSTIHHPNVRRHFESKTKQKKNLSF